MHGIFAKETLLYRSIRPHYLQRIGKKSKTIYCVIKRQHATIILKKSKYYAKSLTHTGPRADPLTLNLEISSSEAQIFMCL